MRRVERGANVPGRAGGVKDKDTDRSSRSSRHQKIKIKIAKKRRP